MSDPRAAWAEAFAKAQAELPLIPKTKTATIPTKTGGSYAYQFADLPDVLAVTVPVLNRHGLSVGQSVAGDAREVAVTTRIYHTSGHTEEFGPLVLASGGDARSAGSAITYAKRYGLCSALGVAPEDDDDGAHARPRPQPDPVPEAEVVIRLANRLKAKALEAADGDTDLAKIIFASATEGVRIGPDTVADIEADLAARGAS